MTKPTPLQIRDQDARLIQIVDHAFADSAARSGNHLVCHPGCTQCCHGAFAINALDAQRLRLGMEALIATNPGKAQAVADRTKAYLAEFSPSFPGNPKTGILGSSEEDQAAFEDFANEAACPALDPQTGLCDLYEFRPMTCRVFGPPVRIQFEQEEEEEEAAFSVCELCFTSATPEEIAAAEMHVPHADEAALLAELEQAQLENQGEETIIAYCLTEPSRS
jgi:Fe-S-cluster containining protein